MKRLPALLTLTLLCLSSASAVVAAAAPPPPVAIAAPPSPVTPKPDDSARPRKVALARRYFVAMHFGDVMDQMMRQLLPAMLSGELKRYPNLPANYRSALSDALVGAFHDVMPDVIDGAVEEVADLFTEDELQKLVDFYESDTGQSVMRKSMALGPGMEKAFEHIEPRLKERMMHRLCAKVDCHDLPAPVTS
jgi:hypothetical protein